MTRPRICVLMPVHAGTPADQLAASLSSIAAQSVPADEILVVQDGPLTPDHDLVLSQARGDLHQLEILTLPQGGIAAALQAGLQHTRLEWVARMDADDVAEPGRLSQQAHRAATGEVDVIGSAMLEFGDDPAVPTAVRRMPLDHAEILRQMRRVNPVNHPTVMFRRSTALAVGGYQRLAGLEDYDLWARLAAAGARFCNLPEPLVRYRVDAELYRRRRGRALLLAEVQLQRNLRKYGIVGRLTATTNAVSRIGFRLLPPTLMRLAYRALHSRTNPANG